MDLITAFVGLVVGLIVGFVVAWFWAKSTVDSNKGAKQSSETELKILLAQQAQSHLQTSRQTIESIEHELSSLRNSVADYEKSLSDSSQDYSKTNFFGEHTSMFLRNSENKSNLGKTSQHSDNQPKDFANSGSGVFAGSMAAKVEEKSNN